MREDTLRAVLMVRAIEEVDRAGTLLPPGDRAQATREAVRALGAGVDEVALVADDRLLARALGDRAERLVGPLVERSPIVGEALGRTRTPAGLLIVLLLAAFASGIGLSALDGSRRINILAFPFLGLIAWNFAMYAVLAIGWIRGRMRPAEASPSGRGWTKRLFERRIAQGAKLFHFRPDKLQFSKRHACKRRQVDDGGLVQVQFVQFHSFQGCEVRDLGVFECQHLERHAAQRIDVSNGQPFQVECAEWYSPEW